MKRHLVKIFLAAFIPAVLLMLWGMEKDTVLTIRDVEHKIEKELSVPGKEFTLIYTHSVHKTPVYETFIISKDNRFILKEVRYSSLGVGMPFTDEGGVFTNENGQFVLRFDRTLQAIPIRVSPIPDHAIQIGNATYPLLAFAKPESLLEIRAKQKLVLKNINYVDKGAKKWLTTSN